MSESTGLGSTIIRSLRDDGTIDAEFDPLLSNAEVLRAYRSMVQTRWLDERLTVLQRQGRIGFHVGSLGEEAAIIGAALAIRETDWIFPCYREFGAALLRGLDFQRFIDNMYGNANDTAKGRQMPDHYTSRQTRFVSVSSPVGTQITQAVGFAWAAKLRKDDVATLVYFGDGATSSADFHAGMNFGGVFRTPTIFLCRNNGWAISVPADQQTASVDFACKGNAYGVTGVRVDGNDLFAVAFVVKQALAACRTGEGPVLVEALTYRMGGHSTSDDPNAYRTSEDLKTWAARDPIERVLGYLKAHDLWDEGEEARFIEQLTLRFRAAVEHAEQTEKPPLASLFEDVYAELPWHLRQQRDQLLSGPRPPKAH